MSRALTPLITWLFLTGRWLVAAVAIPTFRDDAFQSHAARRHIRLRDSAVLLEGWEGAFAKLANANHSLEEPNRTRSKAAAVAAAAAHPQDHSISTNRWPANREVKPRVQLARSRRKRPQVLGDGFGVISGAAMQREHATQVLPPTRAAQAKYLLAEADRELEGAAAKEAGDILQEARLEALQEELLRSAEQATRLAAAAGMVRILPSVSDVPASFRLKPREVVGASEPDDAARDPRCAACPDGCLDRRDVCWEYSPHGSFFSTREDCTGHGGVWCHEEETFNPTSFMPTTSKPVTAAATTPISTAEPVALASTQARPASAQMAVVPAGDEKDDGTVLVTPTVLAVAFGIAVMSCLILLFLLSDAASGQQASAAAEEDGEQQEDRQVDSVSAQKQRLSELLDSVADHIAHRDSKLREESQEELESRAARRLQRWWRRCLVEQAVEDDLADIQAMLAPMLQEKNSPESDGISSIAEEFSEELGIAAVEPEPDAEPYTELAPAFAPGLPEGKARMQGLQAGLGTSAVFLDRDVGVSVQTRACLQTSYWSAAASSSEEPPSRTNRPTPSLDAARQRIRGVCEGIASLAGMQSNMEPWMRQQLQVRACMQATYWYAAIVSERANAALLIQAAQRGRLARRRVMAMRRARERKDEETF
eukprot:TRINITY_DN17240_c0_g1_i2.p1 TRINITY_DN17240_c0_g1~~TRINITY_DN17240_c0_g1_i2.p1  ORF type:complete len:653 (+),score=148.54 TRINITY_DN17240_c0_g1_i2:154-2112(+)